MPDQEIIVLSQEDQRTLTRMFRWFKNLKGPGITNGPNGPSFHFQQSRQSGGGDGGKAIRDIRFNATTGKLQVSYKANPTVDADWEDKITFGDCT